MDRLHVVVALAALAGLACEDSSAKDAPTSGRVNAAAPKQVTQTKPKPPAADLSAFCDVHRTGNDAVSFEYPELDSEPPKPTKSWRWINVWATWCKPCIEELPLLATWRDQLSKKGVAVELVFISVDESRDEIAAFRKQHKNIPDTLRVTDPDAVGPWVHKLGLDESAPLPIHLFVAPDGQTRCLRSGGVGESDLPAVSGLLSKDG